MDISGVLLFEALEYGLHSKPIPSDPIEPCQQVWNHL